MSQPPTEPTRRCGIDWGKAQTLRAAERARFEQSHPQSRALSAQGAQHLLFGVPLHWMTDWGLPFTLHVAQAQGATVTDVDGHVYTDFCLGDTGAMFGHSPEPVARAVAQQAARGFTTMLPTADAEWVAAELARRFGLPLWQFALSASDANRFAIRWARAATGRSRIVVFNGCYHGTVDDVFVDLVDGQPVQRDSLLGQVYDLRQGTRVVEFNDLAALDAALADGSVAAVLAEPAMTNIGMVLPDAGYWDEAQAIIKRHGSLLLIDETHTISTGPGGCTRAWGLRPDLLVVGKPLGGGVACAAYGFSAELAARAQAAKLAAPAGHSGIGTTLTANMLMLAAMRANLAEVMTEPAYAQMALLAGQLAAGLREVIARRGVPWCVTQVGARTEIQFATSAPRNGSEAGAILDGEVEHLLHLFLANRGVLITPFHNMMLVCPHTTAADVARLVSLLDDGLAQIV
jgi:glutamate-1-semialdehyde 2,1-aminomutase